MSDLKERSEETELLDDLSCRGHEIDKNLKELKVINKWLGGDYVTIKGIAEIIKSSKIVTQPITIGDLGCGGGDMLVKVAKWARKKNIKVFLLGIDANNYIINYARKNTEAYPEIEYLTINILSEEFKTLKFDIITSTLFTHHFTSDELSRLYVQLNNQARLGVLTNDIHRHFLAYHSINLLTSLFSRSYMVKNDAGLSVKRAFKEEELRSILANAGIKNFKIKWMWAFRWQLIIKK